MSFATIKSKHCLILQIFFLKVHLIGGEFVLDFDYILGKVLLA